MPRPSHTPRIGSVEPHEVAARAVQIAAARATLKAPEDHRDVPLGRDTELLARYAASGSTDEGIDARDLLERVARGIYGSSPEDVPADLNSILCVVILSAAARIKIASRPPRPVTTSEFAAVAGIDRSTVRRMMREGSLTRVGRGLVDPASAAASLAAARAKAAPSGAATR